MIYFDLESHLGTLYKIEAIFWENGKPKDKFFAVTNADMPDAVRRITGITHEQSLTGTDERETVFAFWNFLQRNHAVATQKIVVNGKEYHKISCIGYGVSRELQKIFLRFGIRLVFDNEERGDLYEYAKTYCNHLPLKSFRQSVMNRYFSIQERELKSLPLLHTALIREATRQITEEECERLVNRLTNLSAKDEDLLRSCERIGFDLFRIFTISEKRFAVTLSFLFERTKTRPYAEDDWRRIVANIETRVKRSDSAQMMQRFENSLPEQIQAIYPLELSYKILDGEGRVGANLIEISYKRNKILLECGTELEATEYGRQMREAVFRNRYDACLITHYHSDHAGMMERMQIKTATYIGSQAKKILQVTTHNRYKNVHEYRGKFAIGEITVTPFLCDHSALDSYMLLFEAGGRSLLYTGDFRAHGRKNFDKLLLSLPKVDVLICEHTNGDGIKQWSEQALEKIFTQNMRGEQDVYVVTSATNFDRIVTVYKACLRTKRVLIVDKIQAKILNTIGGSIPHPRSHKNIKVIGEKGYALADLAARNAPYAMLVRSSIGQEVDFLLGKRKNAQCIYSMWKGYQEKEDMKILLELFQKREIEIKVIHTSGHADGSAIRMLIDRIQPQEIKFVHGENIK